MQLLGAWTSLSVNTLPCLLGCDLEQVVSGSLPPFLLPEGPEWGLSHNKHTRSQQSSGQGRRSLSVGGIFRSPPALPAPSEGVSVPGPPSANWSARFSPGTQRVFGATAQQRADEQLRPQVPHPQQMRGTGTSSLWGQLPPTGPGEAHKINFKFRKGFTAPPAPCSIGVCVCVSCSRIPRACVCVCLVHRSPGRVCVCVCVCLVHRSPGRVCVCMCVSCAWIPRACVCVCMFVE